MTPVRKRNTTVIEKYHGVYGAMNDKEANEEQAGKGHQQFSSKWTGKKINEPFHIWDSG